MINNEFIKFENHNFMSGVSGIMRVKNDAEFIEASIHSCINALDELIIVYNDCSDNSPQIIEKMRRRYPNKIKVYEYKYKVYSINLTKEEYLYAKSLPIDSPHLLCNYYNFALSKVSYDHAMKIDADQIYFTDRLEYWCNTYRNPQNLSLNVIIGFFVWLYIRLMNKLNKMTKHIFPLLGKSILQNLLSCYNVYVQYSVIKSNACISLSGINVFYNNDWFVPLGKTTDIINILPPYNGTGDHLIFKVDNNTYYLPWDSPSYNLQRSDKHSLIEYFSFSKRIFSVGTCWFHLNAMRANIYNKVKSVQRQYPNSFIKLNAFFNTDYDKKINNKIDNNMANIESKSLFQFLSIIDKKDGKDQLKYLSVDPIIENS